MTDSIRNFSSMTGLSEAELAKRAEQMVDVKTGKIAALSALDAALVAAQAGGASTSFDSFQGAAAVTADPHAIEEPTHAYQHAKPAAGFAPATNERANPNAHNVLDSAAKTGQAKIAKSGLLDAVLAPGGIDPAALAGASDQLQGDSRNIQFEMLKNEIQKMSQAMQAMSNTLNAMHEQAMTAIRNAKA